MEDPPPLFFPLDFEEFEAEAEDESAEVQGQGEAGEGGANDLEREHSN